MPVTRLTDRAASADNLTEADYREIYLELAQNRTTRQLQAILGEYSNAWWSEFGHGRKPLTERARAALRRAVGLPELPPAVADVLAGVDPDAEVVSVEDPAAGPGARDRVILAGRRQNVRLHLTSTDVLIEPESGAAAAVTPVTRQRRPRRGVGVTPATDDQNRRRQALGASWRDVFEAGLAALESARKENADEVE